MVETNNEQQNAYYTIIGSRNFFCDKLTIDKTINASLEQEKTTQCSNQMPNKDKVCVGETATF